MGFIVRSEGSQFRVIVLSDSLLTESLEIASFVII